ncbi:spore germination protein [Virgibacillus phasianinus]|uniref:Spore germination protein n=1 Tax=Virgibacillus phasianinus TaxID=2017483 RepID=A0A220U6F0_9BACI|nr:spore germination protein [Virgibacillus phasianinus]ASK63293.1 spore germination protein [Virgibacillus phasianinus]
MAKKQSNESKKPIPSNIDDVEAFMKEQIGTGKSFDLGFREIIIMKKKIQLYYVTGLTDSSVVLEVIKKLVDINDKESNMKKIPEIIKNRLIHQQVEAIKTMDEAVDQILSGLTVVFMDGEKQAYVVDVRNYPGRTPQEPDSEQVVRGSRDGFTENIIENTALTRRRVRDARLRNEMLKVGERSKTDVCVSYLKDVADDGLVEVIKEKIGAIEVDGITMADKAVEEFIIKRKWSPYPLVRYTERPDIAANHLLEGHVLITVDTSPSLIILPTTYFHHLQHAEEYRQAPAVGTFIRWSRYIAVLMSLFLLPLWLLFVMEPSLLPDKLSFIGLNEKGNVPVFVQIIMGDLGIEFLRMAAIHTPTPLSTAMGLIAAVLIGQIAIDVGLFSPEVILYISIAAIGSYVTPSYELSSANKLARMILVLITAIFGLIGLTIGFTLYVLFLTSLKSIRTPYLWPLLPFNPKAMVQVIFRVPVPLSNDRPSIVHPKNNYRQPPRKDELR